MKILSPLSDVREVELLADAGAGELYCGVMDKNWKARYTNVASPNRREWTRSNLPSWDDLNEVVKRAHSKGLSVYLTLNALYTKRQMEMLERELDKVDKIPVDALIVADPGLLVLLKKRGWNREIHLSTGATVFNSETARFYREHFNINRIVVPRHHNPEEIARLAAALESVDLECFIFNSGCRNIDGFCTYHHGANEILHGAAYSIPKKLGLDYLLLKILRNVPDRLAAEVSRFVSGRSDSACLLNWDVEPLPLTDWPPEKQKKAARNIQSAFCLWQGLDPCGACHIPALCRAGIKSLKIVGRENPTEKKVKDVSFLKEMLNIWQAGGIGENEFKAESRRIYRERYGVSCKNRCYYPEEPG